MTQSKNQLMKENLSLTSQLNNKVNSVGWSLGVEWSWGVGWVEGGWVGLGGLGGFGGIGWVWGGWVGLGGLGGFGGVGWVWGGWVGLGELGWSWKGRRKGGRGGYMNGCGWN